jgi:hypothetical protein
LKLLPASDLSTDEMLKISISAFSGKVKCQLKALEEDASNVGIFELLLNDDFYPDSAALKQCLQKMQVQLMTKRYQDTISDGRLININLHQFPAPDRLKELPDDKLCLRLALEPRIYLVSISFSSYSILISDHFFRFKRRLRRFSPIFQIRLQWNNIQSVRTPSMRLH